MKFELPKLSYSFDSLEPFIDAQTMEIHYTKHHATYVNNLNTALEKHPELNYSSLEKLLLDVDNLPSDIKQTVINNGGGHYNHTHYWKVLTPNINQIPQGELLTAIERDFGSFDEFKNQFDTKGKTHFGSGWVWLVKDNQNKLSIISLPNQNAPLTFGTPLLGIDLWEHAYYLKHQNRRPDYLFNIWSIINWRYVESLYLDN